MSKKTEVTKPSAVQLIALHKFAANCFVATVGTVGNRTTKSELENFHRQMHEELKQIDQKPLVDIWRAALDQAAEVLANDSIAQRLSRSAQLAEDLLPLAIRIGLTPLTSGDYVLPPLSFASNSMHIDTTPGRCK